MLVDDSLADERDGDTCGTEEQGLSTSNTVEDEEDENKVGNGSDDVVNACDKDSAVACDAERFVKYSLVVSDDVCEYCQYGGTRS